MENKQEKDFVVNQNSPEIVDLDDYEDGEEYVDLPEPKVLDPELYSIVSAARFVEPSNFVEERVVSFYRKKYRYRIILYNFKLKVAEYKEALFGSIGGLEIALTSMVVLFILGGITYYQYAKSQNVNLSNQITKEQNKVNQPQIKDISQTIRGSFVTDARTLTSVKKIYVEILGNDETLENIQNQVIDRFSKNNIFIITEKNNADAVLRFSVILSSNELFARLVDRKNNVIWSVNKSVTNKSNLGIEIVNILTEDINEAKNK